MPGEALDRSKELTRGFCSDLSGGIVLRLRKLLYSAGLDGVSTVSQTGAEAVVGTMRDHPGIYLFIAGTHVMAASSLPGREYLLDNESGLYKCDDATALFNLIKNLRRSEWNLTGTYGWYAVKCM
jgi:hypothetical protein